MADTVPPDVADAIRALSSTDSGRRKQSRERLAAIGKPAVPALLLALGDPASQVRWEVVKTLHAIADPLTAPRLVELLADEESNVRWAASEALVALRRSSLAPLLRALIGTPDSAWLYDGARRVLAELANDNQLRRILHPLLEALKLPAGREREMGVPGAARAALEQYQSLTAS